MAYLYKYLGKYLTAAGLVLALAGCVKDDTSKPKPTDPDGRVFLMYDNIGVWFDADVAEAAEAVAAGALTKENQRVIVFHRQSTGSVIYELVQDKKAAGGYRKEMVKAYARGENNDLSVETIRDVVADVRDYAPAKHYGLAFGSHGKGWIPKNNPSNLRRSIAPDPSAELWAEPENGLTRYLAYDWSSRIDIGEFADALDEWEWDFILFDDCFMTSVEALYEIRHLAEYFIGSPTEIMKEGFPYDRVTSRLFADWEDDLELALKSVSKSFVDWYREGNSDVHPCATVAVVKTWELDDLAMSVRDIARSGLWTNVDPSRTPVQYYEGMASHVFYDLDDYLRNGIAPTSDQYRAFTAQLEKVVVFDDHTEMFYSDYGVRTTHPINHYSGLNVFIPYVAWNSLIPAYRETQWYKYVYEQ